MEKGKKTFGKGWKVALVVGWMTLISALPAFAAGTTGTGTTGTIDPFSQLNGTSTLPTFLTDPMAAARSFLGLVLLIVAGWKMGGAYMKGQHRIVYASALVLGVIEWVLWSPGTLFNAVSVAFNWISTHWFSGS